MLNSILNHSWKKVALFLATLLAMYPFSFKKNVGAAIHAKEKQLNYDIKAFGESVYLNVMAEDFLTVEKAFSDCMNGKILDLHNEEICRQKLYVFQRFDTTYEKKLEKWLLQSPKNDLATLAMAVLLSNKAWLTRGNEFLSKTPVDDVEKFNQYLGRSNSNLQALVNRSPHNTLAQALYVMSLGSMGKKHHQELKSFYEKAVSKNPYSFFIRVNMMNRNVPRWGGSYEYMRQLMSHSVPYQEKAPYLKKLEYQIYLAEGWDYLNGYGDTKQDCNKAIDKFKKALQIYPESLRIKASFGWALWVKGDNEGIQLLKQVVDENPYDSYHVGLLIDATDNKNYTELHLKTLEDYTNMNPNSYRKQYQYCLALRNAKKLEKALKACEQAIIAKPFNPLSYRTAGYLKQDMGEKIVFYWKDKSYLSGYLAHIIPMQRIVDYAVNNVVKNLAQNRSAEFVEKERLRLVSLLNIDALKKDLTKEIEKSGFNMEEIRRLSAYYANRNRSVSFLKQSFVEKNEAYFKKDMGKELNEKFFKMVFELITFYIDTK